jgi:hypothetical protein
MICSRFARFDASLVQDLSKAESRHIWQDSREVPLPFAAD